MQEQKIRQIIREEFVKLCEECGIKLNESKPKKGDSVLTPHGAGVVLSLQHPNVRVKLNGGATLSINRSKVIVKN